MLFARTVTPDELKELNPGYQAKMEAQEEAQEEAKFAANMKSGEDSGNDFTSNTEVEANSAIKTTQE